MYPAGSVLRLCGWILRVCHFHGFIAFDAFCSMSIYVVSRRIVRFMSPETITIIRKLFPFSSSPPPPLSLSFSLLRLSEATALAALKVSGSAGNRTPGNDDLEYHRACARSEMVR